MNSVEHLNLITDLDSMCKNLKIPLTYESHFIQMHDYYLLVKLNDLDNRCITNFLEDDNAVMRLYKARGLAMFQSNLED